MKNLIEYILIHLVEHPEEVKVVESEDDRGAVYTIHVHKDDIGRVIGKGGSVIQSIRNIGKIRAVKEGIHAYINLAEDEDEE
ncbi:MAG: KH domain-containing protein [Pseudomonadales bacterium]|nr:KH domain-containing protein [Pseudomonadales bacterium]